MKLILLFLLLISCATRPPEKPVEVPFEKYQELLDQAELRASNEGRSILILSRSMIRSHEKIEGSCWNYINNVYHRAGYPELRRDVVFKSKLKGPYLKQDIIVPGDWLYYVNHSYHGKEHSGVFVEWTDFNRKQALIMSYAGEGRKTGARYKKYIIDRVYNIIRAKP